MGYAGTLEGVCVSLDLQLVASRLAKLPPRLRAEAIFAITQVFMRAACAQMYAAPGTAWEDADTEGRVLVTFAADQHLVAILDVSFLEAPLEMGGGRFVVQGATPAIYPIPNAQGPRARHSFIIDAFLLINGAPCSGSGQQANSAAALARGIAAVCKMAGNIKLPGGIAQTDANVMHRFHNQCASGVVIVTETAEHGARASHSCITRYVGSEARGGAINSGNALSYTGTDNDGGIGLNWHRPITTSSVALVPTMPA